MSNIPINVTVRHLEEPASKFQPVIQSEIGKLESIFHNITDVSVVIEGISKIVSGAELKRKVDITANIKGSVFAATAEEENFGKALDTAIAKIRAQLSKHQGKANEYKGASAAEVAVK
ncbi:MAG: ribosome-associated translation inhibitor RaiA [Fibromonadaceae bacterium]|jgi:putative sigma-54 modulation protein|nr:ribosome-associated translation inhibitor RaiA [Fibromonadaceae bacterium]